MIVDGFLLKPLAFHGWRMGTEVEHHYYRDFSVFAAAATLERKRNRPLLVPRLARGAPLAACVPFALRISAQYEAGRGVPQKSFTVLSITSHLCVIQY